MGESRWKQNDWLQLRANLILAYAYYLKDDKKRSLSCVRQFMQHGRRVQVTVQSYPYLMEICWAMEQGKFPRVCGLCLEKEIEDFTQGINVFTKGVAYRYQALLQRIFPTTRSFSLCIPCSPRRVGPSDRTGRVPARTGPSEFGGEEERFKDMTSRACRILSSFNEALVPDDLDLWSKIPWPEKPLRKFSVSDRNW